jgi:hypothetical protein
MGNYGERGRGIKKGKMVLWWTGGVFTVGMEVGVEGILIRIPNADPDRKRCLFGSGLGHLTVLLFSRNQ